MKKQTRNEKLHDRAARCSDRLRKRGVAWDNAHNGFVEGYMAAMRDMRKVIDNAPLASTYDDCPHVYTDEAITKFLRPIR